MTDVLARVEALIARAASDHVEEARTSAFHACRLIREHGLEVRYRAGFEARAVERPRRDAVDEQAMREWEERVERERRRR